MTTMMDSEQGLLKNLEPVSPKTIFTEKTRSAEKTREALAATVLAKFQQTQNDRFKQERKWYFDLAFYLGEHYIRFKTDKSNLRHSIYTPQAPYWRVRPRINQVRKICRKEMSRLTSQQPNAYVIPSSLEDRDIFAAQAGEQIWSSVWRQYKFNVTLRRAVFWQTICGNGFIKQFWNDDKVDKLNDQMGDLEILPITPFHVFIPDLKEEELENQPFVMHAQARDKAWLQNRLGKEFVSTRLQSVDDSMYSIMGIGHQAERSSVITLECWVRPGIFDELPEGGVCLVIDNQVVAGSQGWPYTHNEYPFSKLDGIPTGKFYNDSIVDDLIPLQQELNRSRGQIIEAKNSMAKPRLLAEEGAIDPARITSEPGQVILYKTGYNLPTELGMQNMPSYVTEEINRTYTDMADLSGQHEVSKGQVPPGVTAAVAISYLQEQDESIISAHFDSIEEGIEKTARQLLSYVKDYWDEERTVKMTGIDSAFDVQAFKGSDLNGNTDIRVESGSALPTSRAAKQAFIMDLMKMGWIKPERGLEVMEIGGLNKIYEQVQVDARQAQRENLKMRIAKPEDISNYMEAWAAETDVSLKTDPKTGAALDPPLIVPVHDYDNHPIHIEEHNRYRKSQAYETADTHTKRLFDAHVKAHMEGMAGLAATNAALPPDMQNPLEAPPGTEGMNAEQPGMEQPGMETDQPPQGEVVA
jgi:hypothetical protein